MARKSRKNIDTELVKAALYIRTALYVRLSVEDGKGRSNSIENQQLILNDFIADKPEFMVVDTYIDNGLSGMTFDRPDFKRMLTDIENGKINCVIVKDLSRLGRNSIDTGYYIERYFVQHKVRFISVNDNYDSADESSYQNSVILPLKNMINEAYSLDIGKKIKAQAHQAMLDGDFIGARAPFGYRKDPDNCHKLLIDEKAAPIVRQIFEWAADGIGINTIVVRLNEMGAVTSSVHKSQTSEPDKNYRINQNWTTFTVAHILENAVYMGDMVQGKSKTIEHHQQDTDESEYIIVKNTHEPIVSRELFEKAYKIRAAVREEYRGKPVDPYTENIFKGKVFCPHCGKPLHRQRNKRKTMPDVYRFHCISPSRVSKDACVGVNIDESVVIEFVCSAVESELKALGKAFSDKRSDSKIEALKKSKSDKLRELNRVQGLVRGLYESLVKGIISNDDYSEFKNAYGAQVSKLKEEIEQLDTEIRKLTQQREKISEVKDSAKTFKATQELTAELIDRLIERIEISHDREISITFRSDKEGV